MRGVSNKRTKMRGALGYLIQFKIGWGNNYFFNYRTL